MRNFSDIKHRISSVSDTRKITGAMETISVAKMRKAITRYENNKEYFETIRKTMNDIVLFTGDVDHKVFGKSEMKRPAFVVIASDKGLAGGFNHNVLEFAHKKITACENAPHIFTVGQVCKEFFIRRGCSIDASFADASYDPTVEQAAEMSEVLYRLFENDKIDSAFIIFTSMDAHNKMEPTQIGLLPFDSDDVLSDKILEVEQEMQLREILFEPAPEKVLVELIPQYLTGTIYGALIQSSACEHSMRQAAMHSATRNATELLDKLQLEYNRARQDSVTGELIEIVTAEMGVIKHDGK